MITPEPGSDPASRQRLLECWLPLAQEASARFGWRLDGRRLEALVLAAAPALGQARSALGAYAILWATYTRAAPRTGHDHE